MEYAEIVIFGGISAHLCIYSLRYSLTRTFYVGNPVEKLKTPRKPEQLQNDYNVCYSQFCNFFNHNASNQVLYEIRYQSLQGKAL